LSDDNDENLEIAFVEDCLVKIAIMLALGFGEAGTKIITDLLKRNHFSVSHQDSKGEKVMAIFGFIMINQFN
jgi:hypothetical protein